MSVVNIIGSVHWSISARYSSPAKSVVFSMYTYNVHSTPTVATVRHGVATSSADERYSLGDTLTH